jgi:hypothetical protein
LTSSFPQKQKSLAQQGLGLDFFRLMGLVFNYLARGFMTKSDKHAERAELERLMANFNGETKLCPPLATTPNIGKRKRRKAGADGRLEAAEATMRIEARPVEEAKDATKDGSVS